MLERVPPVMHPLGLNVGGVRFFGCRKSPQVDALLLRKTNPRLKFVSDYGNAQESRLVSDPSVPPVLGVYGESGVAQIADAVVIPHAVDVVDYTLRPLSVDKKPSQAMLSLRLSHKVDAAISLVPHRTSDLPSFCKSASVLKPHKNASFGIVMQKLFQVCVRSSIVKFSHFIAPVQRFSGQGIGASGKCYFPRLNITEAA